MGSHSHVFSQVSDDLKVCSCGMSIKPRIRLTKQSADMLMEAINSQLRITWEDRVAASERGGDVSGHNRSIRRLRDLLEQVRSVKEDFGWA